MNRIDSMEDNMNGVCTYELKGGKRVRLSVDAVRELGAAECVRRMGHGDLLPTERLPVMQRGRRVGTMPADFDPTNVKSGNWLYEPRSGDFTREKDHWAAANNLGPGDLDAVVGFVRETFES